MVFITEIGLDNSGLVGAQRKSAKESFYGLFLTMDCGPVEQEQNENRLYF